MKTILLISVFLLSAYSYGQNRMIIYFTDKGSSEPIVLSERSLERRTKNHVPVDEKDRVIYEPYIVQLAQECKILNRSRWLNAITVETELTEQELLTRFDFISDIWVDNPSRQVKTKFNEVYTEPKALNYGVADTQVRQIDADCLHDMGFAGAGVYLAIIDAGFKGMDTVSYFSTVYSEGRVLDSHDFVNNATVYDYSLHGTAVGSCIFGEKSGPGEYAGTAVDVDVALYVSEDVLTETLIEEFNLVAALERCDSVGVDVVNISLGYSVFDNSNDDHPYADMNGNTTIAATGVNTAASKGIVVLAAAGNEGPSTISTPCDADNGLCVGAVDNQGNYAPFSSVGPSADNQVKPDISATGWNAWVVLDDGSLVMGNGTSFATPIMTGGVACLIQANPTKTVAEIISSLHESGTQFVSPDEFLGYGIPQLCGANAILSTDEFEIKNRVEISPVPATDIIQIRGLSADASVRIEVINALGQVVAVKNEVVTGKTAKLSVTDLNNGVYFLRIGSVSEVKRIVIRH